MVCKEDVEFYRNFSRKELQTWCKKHGLPANRSSSDMAESLVSHFKKNSLSSIYLGRGLNGTQKVSVSASLVPSSQAAPLINFRHDMRKGCDGATQETLGGNYYRATNFKKLDPCMENKVNHQELSGGLINSCGFYVKDMVPNRRRGSLVPALNGCLGNRTKEKKGDVNDGAFLPQSGPPGYATASCSSSFEFHASSEEGIDLCVDLNFNPSDWINKLKREVSICDNISCKKPRSSHQETELFTEVDKERKGCSPLKLDINHASDGNMLKETFSALELTENKAPGNHRYKGQGTPVSSLVEPGGRCIHSLEHSKDDETITVLTPHSNTLGHIISYAVSGNKQPSIPNAIATGKLVACAKSCSKSVGTISHDLDCVTSPTKRMVCNSAVDTSVNPTYDSLKDSIPKIPSDINERALAEGDVEIRHCSNRSPTCTEDGCTEIFSPDGEDCRTLVACLPCLDVSPLDSSEPDLIVNSEPDRWSKSTEIQLDTGRSCLQYVEEQERSEIINGTEQSK